MEQGDFRGFLEDVMYELKQKYEKLLAGQRESREVSLERRTIFNQLEVSLVSMKHSVLVANICYWGERSGGRSL
jgi:hypothetical protein